MYCTGGHFIGDKWSAYERGRSIAVAAAGDCPAEVVEELAAQGGVAAAGVTHPCCTLCMTTSVNIERLQQEAYALRHATVMDGLSRPRSTPATAAAEGDLQYRCMGCDLPCVLEARSDQKTIPPCPDCSCTKFRKMSGRTVMRC